MVVGEKCHYFLTIKAELLQEGIFFPHPFICQRRFTNEKVGNQKTKPTFIPSILFEY